MANEATQGIDPDGSEKIMEEAHVIPLWQGINPAVNDSKWCWFRQTSSRKNRTLGICLLHAQWSDFLVCHLCHEGRRDWGSRLTPM